MSDYVLEAEGPYDVDYAGGGRTDSKFVDHVAARKAFWTGGAAKFEHRRGIYIYALRSKGWKPLYVGKATTSSGFSRQLFAADKINRINTALRKSTNRHGTSKVFLLVFPKKAWSDKRIREIETELIRAAWQVNPDLVNRQHIPRFQWSVQGVGSPGARKQAVIEYKRLMNLG